MGGWGTTAVRGNISVTGTGYFRIFVKGTGYLLKFSVAREHTRDDLRASIVICRNYIVIQRFDDVGSLQ